MGTKTVRCPAALNINGEHFACDWPSNKDGMHLGWAHTNADAQAVWTSDPEVDGIPSPASQAEEG